MNKQKKQNLLTIIIILLVMALAILVGSIVYEEIINIKKQQTQDASASIEEKDDKENQEDKENVESEQEAPNNQEENENDVEDETEKQETPAEEKENYVGKEESDKQEETTQNIDEKAIDLVKKEWGKDDTVTFSIEKKNGAKYRIAVRDASTSVLAWYEVNTDTWEVNEY